MYRRPLQMAARLSGSIALAVVVSGCGMLAGPSEREVVAGMIDQAATTYDSLNAAVDSAVSIRSTMSAEFRVVAGQMEADIAAFNDLADELPASGELADAAETFAQAANLSASLLGDGAIDVASEVNRTQVAPKYAALQRQLAIRQEEVGAFDGGSTWWVWLVAIPLVVFVAYVVIQRRRPTLEDLLGQSKAAPQPEIRTEPGATANRRKRPVPLDQRPSSGEQVPTRHLPPPIGDVEPPPARSNEPALQPALSSAPAGRQNLSPATEPAPVTSNAPIRNPEAIHSVRGGLRTVELRGIIDAALATMVDTGWEVAIECPDVSVLVDPLRMRRLLSNLLLSATAHGAEHIGLVAVIVEDRVEVNVGHDGSLLEGMTDAADVPPEVEHQLTVARQLLAGMHADARWTDWRGVSLYTMELVRGPDEVAGHDLPTATSAD